MNALLIAIGALAAHSGSAGALPPELSPIDPQSVREWADSRGADAEEKAETVEVDLVFNFMKGVGCSDADAEAAAKAAAMRANELLKGACVRVNVKEINNDWTGPGNEDNPDTPEDEADGEVNSDEIRKAKKEGLKEVTGDDGMGGTKKGYKVFIVKDFVGDLDDTVGCTIKCQPWTALQKEAAGVSLGEALAHEIGHSFGKLDDTYDMDDMDCLMYGYAKKGSARVLKEGQGDKIRGGAKKHGRTVKKDADAPEEAPKQPVPSANGGISKLESEPVVNPAGEAVWGSITAPSFLAPGATDLDFEFTVVRPLTSPAPTYIHLGIDLDNDPATGVDLGPWTGIETRVRLFYDPLLKVEPQIEALDLIGGDFYTGPIDVGFPPLLPDEFLPFPAPPVVPIEIMELQLHGVIPVEVFPIAVGPEPAFVRGWVTPQPDPFALPLPQDDPFQFPLLPDDFFGRPILVAPGVALPGDVIPVDGFGFPPLAPVQICVDDVPAGTVMTDPNGQFIGQPLPLDPLVFAADGSGYSFISAKASSVGAAGTTWVEAPGAAPCPADLDGDGFVNANDLAVLLAAWGQLVAGGPDLDGDGFVGAGDLAILLAAWGPCP